MGWFGLGFFNLFLFLLFRFGFLLTLTFALDFLLILLFIFFLLFFLIDTSFNLLVLRFFNCWRLDFLLQFFVKFCLTFSPFVRCFVIKRTEITYVFDKLIDKFLIIDIVGVVSDLRLRAQDHILGFLGVCGEHSPVYVGPIFQIWIVCLVSGHC